MKNIIKYQLSKLQDSELSDTEKEKAIITCSNGVYEDLSIEYDDHVLECTMEWNEGAFSIKITKEELNDILSEKPIHSLSHDVILEPYSGELWETKDGHLRFKSLDGIEDVEEVQKVLTDKLGFEIEDEDDFDDALHEIYTEGEIEDSEYRFEGLYSINAEDKFYLDHHYWENNLSEARRIIDGESNFKEAESNLEEYIEWEEDSSKAGEAYYLRGRICYETNRWEEGINYFKKAIELGYETSDLYQKLGWSYRQTNEIDDSIKAYEKATELDSSLSAAFYMLGLLKAHKGQNEGALKAYSECLKDDKENPDAFMRRGDVLINLGQLERAKSDFENCVSLDDSKAYAFYRLGLINKELGEHSDAAKNMGKALSLNERMKSDTGIWSAKGWCEIKTNQYDEAIESYNEAIKLKEDASFHYWRGISYEGKGFTSFAIEDFKKSIKIDPNFKFSYSKLGSILKENGEAAEAEQYLQKAKELG